MPVVAGQERAVQCSSSPGCCRVPGVAVAYPGLLWTQQAAAVLQCRAVQLPACVHPQE